MLHDGNSHKRQLWGLPSHTTATVKVHCTPFTLPSNGVISLKDSVITLTTNVVFQPECTGAGVSGVSSIADLKDPFYASTIPQTYVIAAATVIAWVLVVMLIIAPRTNFLGPSRAAPGFNNGHGLIGGATGGSAGLIGVGSRPWLQKVAALSVAVSLTIATGDDFKAAAKQYVIGYMDATALREEVLGSLEIRVTRVISDVFVWLAQVQTLIRLFPRHKEKILIKWIGFSLILFDTLFSCLNSFMVDNTNPPREFVDAIPALSYLFELALGLLYAAWVIYYSVTKRRYAFYHPKMRSICLIAVLSLIAILTPVVFFVTDVSNHDVAGWGDYFRWVGAAAASVVVWEWVERIEALERDEKKDGILGREIFDGDEILDVTPSEEAVWTTRRRDKDRDVRGDDGSDHQSSAMEQGLGGVARRFRPRQLKQQQPSQARPGSHTAVADAEREQDNNRSSTISFGSLPRPRAQLGEGASSVPTPPPVAVSPVSRADTTSAASTVYVVQYDPTADIPQPVRRPVDANGNTEQAVAQAHAQAQRRSNEVEHRGTVAAPKEHEPRGSHMHPKSDERGRTAWHAVSNPFKRKRASPPAEVQQARQAVENAPVRAVTPAHYFSPWDIKNQLGVLAAETGEKFRDRKAGRRQNIDLPLTVIPAQPRGSGRAWTPAASPQERDTNFFDTAVTGNSDAASGPSQPGATIADQRNVVHTSNTVVPPESSARSSARPPRADQLSPMAGSSRPIVIPAPRPSPLATHRVSTASSSEDEGNDIKDHG